MSNFLLFVECQNDGRKTKVWMVRNLQNEDLGAVAFSPAWRKYVFQTKPSETSIQFDAGCLEEICVFLKVQTDARRADA